MIKRKYVTAILGWFIVLFNVWAMVASASWLHNMELGSANSFIVSIYVVMLMSSVTYYSKLKRVKQWR